jgi:hypothetical protein
VPNVKKYGTPLDLIRAKHQSSSKEGKLERGVATMEFTITYLIIHGLYLGILAAVVADDIGKAKRGMMLNVKPIAEAA